jgi:hypothetical protein
MKKIILSLSILASLTVAELTEAAGTSFLSAYGKITCGHIRGQAAGGCVLKTNPTMDGYACQSNLHALYPLMEQNGYQPGRRDRYGDFHAADYSCSDGLDGYYAIVYFSPKVDYCAHMTPAQREYQVKVAAQHQRDYPGSRPLAVCP